MNYTLLADAIAEVLGDSIAQPIPARLGNPTLTVTDSRIDVPLSIVDQPGMVYIHGIGDDPQGVSMALNSGPGRIPDNLKIYGQPVLIRKSGRQYVIAGLDYQPSAEYMHNVAAPVRSSVVLGQFDVGLLQATNPRSMRCFVSRALYYVGSTPYIVGAQETRDFTTDIPGTAGRARAVLVTLNPSTGTLAYTNGSLFDIALSHEAAFATYYPINFDDTLYTIGWVRLQYGMAAIFEGVHILAGQEILNKGTASEYPPPIQLGNTNYVVAANRQVVVNRFEFTGTGTLSGNGEVFFI